MSGARRDIVTPPRLVVAAAWFAGCLDTRGPEPAALGEGAERVEALTGRCPPGARPQTLQAARPEHSERAATEDGVTGGGEDGGGDWGGFSGFARSSLS